MSVRLTMTALAALSLAACGSPEPAPVDQTGTTPTEPAAPVAPTAAMGEQVFKRCVACHTIDKGGRNGVGPNLHGIVGRTVASIPGFAYSGAMKAKGGVWDEAALDAYLTAPARALPGGRMAFAGIPEAPDRKALFLYLETLK